MNLEDKINNLKKKIDFDKVDISDEVYGTFIPEKKSTIERAYSTKKIADSLLKTNRKEGNKMYLESVFLYIKGYRDEEVQLQTIKVEAWHGLCKFVEGIVLQLNDTELGLRNVFEFILYNIKMHYLHLEALRCIRKKENAENVLNQYVNMKYIFDRSKIENFRLSKLDDIEEIVNHLVIDL